MNTFRTRRTQAQVKFFIECWLTSDTTAQVVKALRCNRRDWPFSVEKQSVAIFASRLRSEGVKLPYMEHRGNSVDVAALN